MTPHPCLPACIRWLERQDLPRVLFIEHACFEYPWTEDDFLSCLKRRNCVSMVTEECDTIVGFMVYDLHRSSIKLLNFAVDQPWRRRGVGCRMAAALIAKLSRIGRCEIALAARETNLGAHLFFRAQGFRATGVLPAYYRDSGEDAYRMVYRLPGTMTNS